MIVGLTHTFCSLFTFYPHLSLSPTLTLRRLYLRKFSPIETGSKT